SFDKDVELKINSPNMGNLTEAMGQTSEDLVACACHVYQADRVISRGNKWHRELEFHIAVSKKDLWNTLAPQLKKIIERLTGDDVRFQFYDLLKKRKELRLPEPVVGPRPGGICIFSDNLDAVVGLFRESNNKPLIASFRYEQNSYRTQDRLIRNILNSTNAQEYIRFGITTKQGKREATERTSGFLQLALAAAVLKGPGRGRAQKIQVFGNGFSSYHLREYQLCGGSRLPVRDTHPQFLRFVQDLMATLYKEDTEPSIEIINPFQFLTPADVLAQLIAMGQAHLKLFFDSNDCSEKVLAQRLWKGNSAAHCGCCFSCKIRYLAALIAGVYTGGYSAAGYAFDPLKSPAPTKIKADLGRYLAEKVTTFHDNGLYPFADYVRNFLNKTTMTNSGVSVDIMRLAAIDLDMSGQNNSSTSAVEAAIKQVHSNFANKAKRFLPK
ncbi:MAG TPA: hypothetical protein VN843_30625, partial [Anaerolineales bacterium]|nr:hypothetical protein [Anaerolineales bacterium]